MDLELSGKVAVVTGASRGIGLAVVRALAAEGAHVVAGARTTGDELAGVRGEGRVVPIAIDLGTPDGPGRLVEEAASSLGGLDILVNSLGWGVVRAGGPLSVSDDEWQRSLEMNLLSTVRACRAAVPLMRERGGGAIVCVSSVSGFVPSPTTPDYAAAKAAVESFAKSLATAHARDGIRVNVVAPGRTATPMWHGENATADQLAAMSGVTREQALAGAAAGVPLGRFLEPEEVADIIVLVASGRAAGMLGSRVVVDGGLSPIL
jgi:NAD(P)-dependent dehydrogenase (short-subunit alcohol dehydrogenase family)